MEGEHGAAAAGASQDRSVATDKPYRELIEAALHEYQLANWDEAIALFQRAHAMNPGARTLNGIGKAAYENRQYVLAITYLRQALQETRHPVTAKQRAELTDLIRRAEAFVVHFTLDLDPADATLQVDSMPATLTSEHELLMDPGEHELVASNPGRENVVRRVRAVVGQRERLTIALPVAAGAAPAKDQPGSSLAALPPSAAVPAAGRSFAGSTSTAERGSRSRTLTLVGVIAGGAGLVLGGVTGLWALSSTRTLKDECPGNVCQPASRSTLSTAKTTATLSTIGFGVAIAGAALAVVSLLVSPAHAAPSADDVSKQASESAASTRAAARLTFGGAGIALAF